MQVLVHVKFVQKGIHWLSIYYATYSVIMYQENIFSLIF